MAPTRELEDLLRIATEVVPGLSAAVMDGEPGASPVAGRATSGASNTQTYRRTASGDADRAMNRAVIEDLLAHWVTAHPEAGRAYWSLRCWGILIWQPIYLSVIGAHVAQRSPSLDRFTQSVADGWTRTVRFPAHTPLQGDDASLMTLAAHEIRRCCQQIFDELSCVIRLNTHAARCMQAECVLAALLAVRARRPAWDDAQVEALGARWLAALALSGCGGFFAYRRTTGSCALALDRKTCCYHYRRREGELCSTCPRLDEGERVLRLNAERDA